MVRMGYDYKSIQDVLEMIGKNEVYLPAIQRKFIWEPWQIEGLFDSIMREYPIGTFIFWKVDKEKANKYIFYKFLQDYHERDRYRNEKAPQPELKDGVMGVLDGQQRLNSMYVALQGTYASKKLNARWDNDAAFPERKMYINLLKPEKPEGVEIETTEGIEKEDELVYEFKLLTGPEARVMDDTHLWFLVRDVLTWGSDPRLDKYYDDLLGRKDIRDNFKDTLRINRDKIKRILRILHQRIVIEKLISYYTVQEQDLDDVLDIFVRVNSYGKPLTKTDLLLATIASIWDKGRDEIEEFLAHLNKKGDGFKFDNDFVMRACLVLTDRPVLFKVKGFPESNIKEIMTRWDEIKSAIDKSVDLIIEFGFDDQNLTSQNAIIPISYYIINGGDYKTKKDELRKYLIHALLKQIYGNQGDRVLDSIREAIRGMVKPTDIFSFNGLLSAKLPKNRSLEITGKDIEEILEYEKGPYTFMVLSLLYPNLKFGQIKFHQDHMHPESLFTDAKLKSQGIPQELWEQYKARRNKLPNLQLMEGTENEQKNKTPLKDWLNGVDKNGKPNVADLKKFKIDNYIPVEANTDFKEFLDFYNRRKDLLKVNIANILK